MNYQPNKYKSNMYYFSLYYMHKAQKLAAKKNSHLKLLDPN